MKIGIDLGGSHIAVGIVNDEAKLIAKEEENVLLVDKEQDEIKEIVRDRILSLINSLKRKLQIPAFIINEIGIGVPGIVENNIVKKCKKYGVYDWDLAKELQDITNINVKLTNDALASARAEVSYGSLKDTNKSVFLCIGTGIGGAIVNSISPSYTANLGLQDRRDISISDEIFPAEFGHMVIEKNGRRCHCGRRGCFETYCSMRTFKDSIINILGLSADTTSEEIHEILKKETTNERLNMYIDDYIQYLALGICNIINIVNPQKICIGGSFDFFEDVLYDKFASELQNSNVQFEMPKIVLAMLKNDAGIIGSVL